MGTLIQKYAKYWGKNPSSMLKKYDYQPTLTPRLDASSGKRFSRDTLHQIVLWKVNRWPDEITRSQMGQLSALAKLQPKQHRQAEDLLKELLQIKGIGLPMASTIFRFVNPRVFQIIDDRAFRVIKQFLPREKNAKYPSKPNKPSSRQLENYLQNSCDRYFVYLDALHKNSSKRLPFEMADRILYQVDVEAGNKVGK